MKINYGKLVNPGKYYPVNYDIKRDGTRVEGKTELLGADMTENQIMQYVASTKMCMERNCNERAVTDYNGCGHYVCDHHDSAN